MKIEFKDFASPPAPRALNVTRVQIFQRCDANELYHPTQFEIRYAVEEGDVTPTPRLTGGKLCGTTTQVRFAAGTSFNVPCVNPEKAKEVWIQKTPLHSHGQGWPNFNGNHWNSNSGKAPAQTPVTFLMINEVVIY